MCGILIVAIGLFTQRVARADSNKTVHAVGTSPSSQPTEWRGGGIEGVVKDEKGKPIAGARVENPEGDKHQTRRTLTDKNGHYALDDLNERLDGFRVLVRAAGYGPVEQEVKPGDAGKPARVDFTLSRGHVLHGRVVDEVGKPILGAQVSTFGANSMLEPATQSDKDGRFEIDSLPADAKFSFSRSGYTRLWYVPLKLDTSGLVTVVLQPMGVVRGRVVDAETGKPLEHFNVWLNSPHRADGPYTPGGPDRVLVYPGKTFASTDGTFTVQELTNEVEVEVSVAADGHTKCVVPVVVAKTQNEAKPVAFALARIEAAKLATLSGRVLDHKGQPVRGANLRLIISRAPAKGPDDHDFDWYWITGELEGLATGMPEMAGLSYCDQFLKAISDSQGRFEFKDVLSDKHWQLAYWGQGVPKGRVLGTSKIAPGPAAPLTIKIPQPARVIVTIDRVKYPQAWQVGIQPHDEHAEIEFNLRRGQTRVEINDLTPRDYDLLLSARPVLKDGGLNIEVIAIQLIRLKPGETKEVRF
jgi:protocatechuate 3,4-dioxygenase beta subunit